MGKVTRLVFGLLAFLMGASSIAQGTCTLYRYDVRQLNFHPFETTLQAACGTAVGLYLQDQTAATGYTNALISFQGGNGPSDSRCFLSFNITSGPSAGARVDTAFAVTVGSGACPPPPDQCGLAPGSKIKQGFSEGWARSPDVNKVDYVGKVNLPFFLGGGEDGTQLASHCIQKCKARATKVIDRYRSQTPGPNGFYRLSGDYEFEVTGTSASGATGDTCSTANNTQAFNDAVSPQTVPLPCPGTVGEVNGKKVCIPGNTSNTSIPPPSGEPPPGTEQPGNPRAGDIPPAGEGSGVGGASRTPTAGNGTATGGPSGSASPGGGSTGTTPKPGEGQEQANCGAPGQPQCKIDEAGTPTDKTLTADIPKLKGEADEGRSKIAGTQDKGFLSTYTALFDAPPFVACTPFDLPNNYGSLDICGHGETFRAVAAVMWALGGFWWSFSLIREVF